MARSAAYRKYNITINNPVDKGFSHATIKDILSGLTGCLYWCMCDEIGQQGTLHTHVYAAFKNAVMFQTMQQRFYGAHIEDARGTHRENRDYIRKEGKHRETDKADTNLPDTFEESGELPAEPERRIKQSEAILAMIEDGASDAEILRTYPSALNHLPRIQQTRQALLEDKYRCVRRTDLKVRYIHGATGVGKTRSILDEYGDGNVYRVTNYKHPFDGYKGEPVIVFDEFRSSLPLADMLNYLDVYPLMLPSRYADRVACYTRVFIVSNISIKEQYPIVQLEEPASYAAFLRRINDGIWEMLPDNGSESF
jgi:viral replication-associated protein